jgi:hypothetical protein
MAEFSFLGISTAYSQPDGGIFLKVVKSFLLADAVYKLPSSFQAGLEFFIFVRAGGHSLHLLCPVVRISFRAVSIPAYLEEHSQGLARYMGLFVRV